jgi:Protein of unknown function (DUF2939)
MKQKTLVKIVGVVVLGGAVASYVSPYLTLHAMRSAIVDQDADAFASDVDFPAVRESLRAQILIMMQNKLSNDADLKDNPFAGVGMMLGMGVANQVIDTMVTPAGVMQMMANAGPKRVEKGAEVPVPDASSAARSSSASADYSVRYRNWSTVAVEGRRQGAEPAVFTFKRSGLWSWKLTAVTFPPELLSAP